LSDLPPGRVLHPCSSQGCRAKFSADKIFVCWAVGCFLFLAVVVAIAFDSKCFAKRRANCPRRPSARHRPTVIYFYAACILTLKLKTAGPARKFIASTRPS